MSVWLVVSLLSSAAASEGNHSSIHIASLRWDYVEEPFLVTSFIVAIIVVKIAFHHIHFISENVPESCLLIILGLLIGLAYLPTDQPKLLEFEPKVFFLFLLPPIILESAYSLRDRCFMENLGTILLYAVIGTILNIVLVGPLLFGFVKAGAMGSLSLDLLDCLVFSAFIAAVDPVAVLAIFQEIGVNDMLYFMVFGESLFNDAVTIVVYNLVVSFKGMDDISGGQIMKGLASFLAVSIVAMFFGLLCGFITAFITKYTEKIRVVEPITLFGMAYLSYLLSELFHFSGIISIICCGLIQAHYAVENICSKSYITVHYVSKVSSSVTESLIFVILGVMLVNDHKIWIDWNTGFSLIALVLCLIVRCAIVFFLTYLVNLYTVGIRKVSRQEQFVMSYGGLRGAIAFSLVFTLDPKVMDVSTKNTLMTATLFIILFTIFFQGITIKPLVRLLRIQLKTRDVSMTKEVTRGVIENVMTGLEAIIGHRGTHYWTGLFRYVSHRFLRPAVQKHAHRKGKGLVAIETEIALQRGAGIGSTSNISSVDSTTLWKELDRQESTIGLGDYVLEQKDEEKRVRQRRKLTANFDSPSDILFLRDTLMTPLQKTIHYDSSDRNLGGEEDRRRQFEHLASIRRLFAEGKTPGVNRNIVRSALVPLAAGLSIGMGAGVLGRSRQDSQETSMTDVSIVQEEPEPDVQTSRF